MKELEVTFRISNNRLKERRLLLDMTQKRLAAAVGMRKDAYSGLESLRIGAKRKDGSWTDDAIKLAEFHCVEPVELFPDAVFDIKQTTASRRVDACDVEALLSTHQDRLMLSPHDIAESEEKREIVRSALARLSDRERMVVERYFGISCDGPTSLTEIAKALDVSPVRIHQVFTRAIGKLGRARDVGEVNALKMREYANGKSPARLNACQMDR